MIVSTLRFTLYGAGLLLILLSGCSERDSEVREELSGRTLDYPAEVSFLSGNDQIRTTIRAAVADDTVSRSEGLMGVSDLPWDRGMIFIFENEQPRSFWMANTPLSLDLFFINSGMEIVRIHRNTQPYSDRSITSELPAQYVVETRAGFALRHDITEGMRIDYRVERE
ncbi:MAG: DUF192 domain-containing protein [Balneolaceae bacterium]